MIDTEIIFLGMCSIIFFVFFFQAEDGIRDLTVTGVQTCALPISTSPTIFEDKPYLAADDSAASPFAGSVYVTWTRFHFADKKETQFLESPIFFSASRDGGKTWSPPKEISGVNPAVCTFSGTSLPNDGSCREDQFSSPVVVA